MSGAVKRVTIAGREFEVHTLGENDPFTQWVVDGYGEELVRFCRRTLKRHDTVLDVGANIGMTAMILSQHAKVVHAFEPNPVVFELLERNIAANGLTNVVAHRLALAAQPGTMRFVGSSAYGHLNTVSDEGVSVGVDTIDAVVERLKLRKLAAIKMDIEGFEPFALEGAAATIRRLKPALFMEFNLWCLMKFGRVNPTEFAEGLFQSFASVSLATRTGAKPVANDTDLLRHSRAMGGIFDIILKDPTGIPRPPFAGEVAATENTRLKAEMASLRRSTSWRLTSPLRALGRLARPKRRPGKSAADAG